MPANLTTFVLKEAALKVAILKLSWQPGCVYVISFPLTQTLRQGEKPASDWHPCKVKLMAQTNMAQEQPEPSCHVAIKRNVGSHLM